jgi:hypothetical protein
MQRRERQNAAAPAARFIVGQGRYFTSKIMSNHYQQRLIDYKQAGLLKTETGRFTPAWPVLPGYS